MKDERITLDFVRKKQMAQELSISERTLNTWMRQRRIPYFRVGGTVLFRIEDVRRALERYQVRPVGGSR